MELMLAGSARDVVEEYARKTFDRLVEIADTVAELEPRVAIMQRREDDADAKQGLEKLGAGLEAIRLLTTRGLADLDVLEDTLRFRGRGTRDFSSEPPLASRRPVSPRPRR